MAKLLIVDDEDILREMLCDMLEGEGHKTVDYSSSQDAWDYLISDGVSVDAIMTDMQMPQMTGRDFINLIRGDKRFDGVPIILASGTCTVSEVTDLLDLDDVTFLSKPVSMDELFEAVKTVSNPAR